MGASPVGPVVTCDRPNWLICLNCGQEAHVRCASTRASVCPPCGETHRHRVRQVVQLGFEDVRPDAIAVLTLTAPGVNVHCGAHTTKQGQRCRWHKPECRPCECTPPEGVDLAEWNATLTARFNDLITDIRRGGASPIVKGRQPHVPVAYVRGVEVQIRRGALHVHAPLVRTDGKPLHLSKKRLRELAIRHGFGCQMVYDWKPSPKAIAHYVSKYVSKAADQRHDVAWPIDTDEDEQVYRRRGARYRPWTASRNWDGSMKRVKDLERERARQRSGHHGGEAAALDLSWESYAQELTRQDEKRQVQRLLEAFAPSPPPDPPPPKATVMLISEQVEMWDSPTSRYAPGWLL
jgi:hypothetical protein